MEEEGLLAAFNLTANQFPTWMSQPNFYPTAAKSSILKQSPGNQTAQPPRPRLRPCPIRSSPRPDLCPFETRPSMINRPLFLKCPKPWRVHGTDDASSPSPRPATLFFSVDAKGGFANSTRVGRRHQRGKISWRSLSPCHISRAVLQ